MRQQRLARLAYAMQERGITQVIISEDRNLYYYLGQYEESMERLRILLVDDRGGCRCYANELFDIPADSSIEVIRHSDGDESRALRELAENLVRGGQIAVDKEWPSGFLLELIAFAGNRKFIPAGELLRAPMICKDETEQILMRESCRINDLVMEALLSSIDESSTEAGCALPGFVDSKNEEKTERNAGYLVVSHSGGGMLRQGTRKGIRRTPANRGMRAHWVVKGLDISEDVCHGMCP